MVEGIAAVATGVGLLLGFMAVGLPVFAAFLLVNLLVAPPLDDRVVDSATSDVTRRLGQLLVRRTGEHSFIS